MAQTHAATLASRIALPKEGVTLRHLMLVLAGVAILTASAKIQVPFWPVPMNLQTLAIMGIAAAYGSRLGVATVLAYLATGLAGLPVFAGAAAGPAYFAGPTAGYLAGFVVAAFIVGKAADMGWSRSVLKIGAAMLIADIAVFALGLAWLGHAVPALGYSEQLLAAGLTPFVLGDLTKIALAALAVPALWKLVDKR